MGTSYNPSIVKSGLLVYLDAGNKKSYSGSGSSWVDLTKNKYNFTTYNSPTYSASNNGTLTFAKASLQYADYSTSFPSLSNWTAEAWVKFTTTPASSSNVTAIITGNYNLVNNLNFCIGTSNSPTDYTIRAGFYNGAWRHTAGHTPSTGIWYYYVGSYDGANIKLYLNGELFNSTAYVGTSQSGGGIRVARRWDDSLISSNLVDGSIPIVRLYNRALTAAEVSQNYNANKARFGL